MLHESEDQLNLARQQIQMNQSNDASISSTSTNYHKLIEECLFGDQKDKVLNFKNHQSFPSSLEVCLNQTFSQINNRSSDTIKASRYISSLPERILDAPNMNDDYYLNLLDWGECGSLAVSLNNEVYLWRDGEINNLLQLTDSNQYISSVSWMNSKRRSCLAVGLSDSNVQLWDAEKQVQYRILKGHTQRVSSLSWNGCLLSTGSRDSSIITHDVRQKKSIIGVFRTHEQEVCGLKWSPDGQMLASGGNDNTLRLFDFQQQRAVFSQHKAAVKALAWCPWQRNLLASGGGTQDKTIKFWNTEKMELTNSILCDSQVCSLIWSPDDKELLSSHGFQNNQLTLWNYPQMQKITEFLGHTNRVLHMALSNDQQTVCSASSDETLRFWKIFAQRRNRRNHMKNSRSNQDYCEEYDDDDDEDDDYDDQANIFSKSKRDGPFSQNLFIR